MIKVKVDDKIREYLENTSIRHHVRDDVEISGEIYFDGEDWFCGRKLLFGPGGVATPRKFDKLFTEWLKENYPEFFL